MFDFLRKKINTWLGKGEEAKPKKFTEKKSIKPKEKKLDVKTKAEKQAEQEMEKILH